jgi:foldase protein PrsA
MLYSRFASPPSFSLHSMLFTIRRFALLAAVSALALATGACGSEDKKTAEDVPSDAIALLGDTEIPRAEFDELMARAKQSYESQKRPFPKAGTPEYQDLKTRAVAFLVQRYEFRVEGEELAVEVTDEDVDKKLEDIKKESFGNSDKKFEQALKREGLTEGEARDEIRDNLLQEKLYEAVTKDVKVTDSDIEKYYDKNKAQFTQPARRNVRHILVKNKAKADELYGQLQDGANFASLAKQFSQDASTKKTGGKLPLTKGSAAPPFDKAAFALDSGEISKPVKTQFGWHIIEALSPVKQEKETPLAKVKESIRQQLLQQKKNEALEKWLEGLKKKYDNETVYAAGFRPPKAETTSTATTSQ